MKDSTEIPPAETAAAAPKKRAIKKAAKKLPVKKLAAKSTRDKAKTIGIESPPLSEPERTAALVASAPAAPAIAPASAAPSASPPIYRPAPPPPAATQSPAVVTPAPSAPATAAVAVVPAPASVSIAPSSPVGRVSGDLPTVSESERSAPPSDGLSAPPRSDRMLDPQRSGGGFAGAPPHPHHHHRPQGPGDPRPVPRFDKHPQRKRRRRGRDRYRDREHPSADDGRDGRLDPAPGDIPRQGHNQHRQPFPRPPRPEFQFTGPIEAGSGLLEISGKGFGFLRQRFRNFAQSPHDIFVTPEMVRSYGLRDGVFLEGDVRNGPRGPQLMELKKINGNEPSAYKNLPIFEELTAINPLKRILLETESTRTTTRIIDMIAPIGKGQRGLIVAPPRTGKTTLLQHIAEAVAERYPEMKLIILLVDERPEEVTEITRAIPQAEVYASSNDSEAKNHIRIAQVAIERAKRLVEAGEDVFIVLDSITRLARASNNAVVGSGSGRTMSGGIDARALEIPRRLFAAARNTREAGSLTIIGTALIETNSKADELIFQEFKGTGNMELVLDRKIAQQYVYPAVDIFKSGTRREELLLPPHQLEKINLIRRGLAGHKPVEAVERLLHFVRRHSTNAQMLLDIPKAAFVS